MTFAPMRGDDVEAWIRRRRDEHSHHGLAWFALDDLLDDYRLHSDTGTALAQEAPDMVPRYEPHL
jgi:hypothetical protein